MVDVQFDWISPFLCMVLLVTESVVDHFYHKCPPALSRWCPPDCAAGG